MSNEEVVLEYLQSHPDFLEHHPDLLRVLTLPELKERDIHDFTGRVISHLQERVAKVEAVTKTVVDDRRENFLTLSRIHQCVLDSMEVTTVSDFLQLLTETFPTTLAVDKIVVATSSPRGALAREGAQLLTPEALSRLHVKAGHITLRSHVGPSSLFFEEDMRSEALARWPLREGVVMAFGSRGDLFSPHQGTDLILFLTRVLARVYTHLTRA